MSRIGTLTRRSRDVVSSTMVDVAEMKTVSLLNLIARIVAKRLKLKDLVLHRHAGIRKKNHEHKRRELPDHQLPDKRIAACCPMYQEVVANNTEDSTMTEATVFVASLHTVAATETKIISKRSKNANNFVTMPLACAI